MLTQAYTYKIRFGDPEGSNNTQLITVLNKSDIEAYILEYQCLRKSSIIDLSIVEYHLVANRIVYTRQ